MPKTFEYQEQLQTLPLGNLTEVGENFLNWVEPLLTQEEFISSKKNIENFINTDGPTLETKLQEWSVQNNGNWLATLWDNMYLDIRSPLVIDVNYFIKLITHHLKSKYTSFDIAGVLISKLIDIYEDILTEKFEPEIFGKYPMCMTQYKKMFKATRVPKQKRDEYIIETKSLNEHIIVMFKNHMFKMNISNSQGERYSCKMIINTLKNLSTKDIELNDTNVGIITTAPRDEASVILQNIIALDKNNDNFEILKNAVFMVCMDEDSKSLHDFAMSLIASNEDNRYFDKNIQLIFNQSGDFGFNIEHTGADAGSWIHIINIINQELTNNTIDKYLEEKTEEIISIDKLQWQISNNQKQQLQKLKKEHMSRINDLNLEIINLKDFGTKHIKSLKYSPDAFLHLALQLAQYRTFGKLRSTYEAVSTRTYLNGRTECNRPISNEVLIFVKAFDEKNTNNDILKQMMNNACLQHTSRIKDCLGSKGIERYFYAMSRMYDLFGEELNINELPEFFNDEGYKKLTDSFISTSRIESKHFDVCGFGPVVSDGYGFWYNLLENEINMNLTTRKSQNQKYAKTFANAILQSLQDLEKFSSKQNKG